MPSSYSTRLRVELQAAGENLNTWGAPKLNNALTRLEEAIAGRTALAVSGPVTLTSVNGSSDQSREMMIDVTGGSGGTITIPSVEKLYLVRNASSGAVVVTTGAVTNATVNAGESAFVMCDAINCYTVITKQYADSILVLAKAYADSLATTAGNLPGSAGYSDYVLMTQNAGAGGGSPQFFAPAAARTKLGVSSTALAMTLVFGG